MSLITFEANFISTGTPTINLYEVRGDKYTLVKSDDMVETPETGLYTYAYNGNDTLDYSAQMAIGTENYGAVHNGIFSQIFSKAGKGGGGGGTYKLTKAQMKEVVEEMTKLLQENLENIEIELPDDLGETEIAKAVQTLQSVGENALEELKTKNDERIEEIKSHALEIASEKFDDTNLVAKLDQVMEKYDTIQEDNDVLVAELNSIAEVQDEKFKKMAKLVLGCHKEDKDKTKKLAKLIMSIRNESKK